MFTHCVLCDMMKAIRKDGFSVKKNIIWLIVGIVVFVMGSYQNIQYEENSLIVSATVTDVKTTDETDDGPISYEHVYYGEYEVDGKMYSDKNLATRHTSDHKPEYPVGSQIEIKVYPDNPGKKVAEGGIFLMVGFGLIIWNSVMLYKIKKAGKQSQ